MLDPGFDPHVCGHGSKAELVPSPIGQRARWLRAGPGTASPDVEFRRYKAGCEAVRHATSENLTADSRATL